MRGSDQEEALLRELGVITLDERDGTRVHALRERPGTYLIAVFGRLQRDNLGASMTAIYEHVGPDPLDRVLFWALTPSVSYDRGLVTYYEDNPHKSAPLPQEVAVVTSNRMIRMVVLASAVGFRVFTGRRLRAYETIHEAFASASA
jgi:hypothetical protein